MWRDMVVIGAGYGGMAAALTLAEAGLDVVLCEALNYPGGCASTFSRKGYQFESGATLFSGFGDGQLFASMIDKHSLPVTFAPIDPLISFRSEDATFDICQQREETVAQLCALPDAPVEALRRFFALQEEVADLLWPIFDDPGRLPPFSGTGLWWHVRRALGYRKLLPLLHRSLDSILDELGLGTWEPLRQYCNALCQITIQVGTADAEAVFALSAMDYPFRGTGHVMGGIGELGNAMTAAIKACGGEVRMSARVKGIKRISGGWAVETRRGTIQTRQVIGNLIPQAMLSLLDDEAHVHRSLGALADDVAEGWGACMLYLVLDEAPLLSEQAHHYQGIVDGSRPLQMGNHLFCSVSARGERGLKGQRTATVSTHVPIREMKGMSKSEQGAWIADIQQTMRDGLALRFPEIAGCIATEMTASPRTFARFTGRTDGLVGGIPRAKGWRNFRGLFPKPFGKGLWLVGDSVFPGQSTLATAVGGMRTARAALRAWRTEKLAF